MKCQILFSGKNKKSISKFRLPKILFRVLSINFNTSVFVFYGLIVFCSQPACLHFDSFFFYVLLVDS